MSYIYTEQELEENRIKLIEMIDLSWNNKMFLWDVPYDESKGYVQYRNEIFNIAKEIGYIK